MPSWPKPRIGADTERGEMQRIRNEDLGVLAAEVLPERTVLSAIWPSGHGSTTVASACSTFSGGDPTAAIMRAVASTGAGNSTSCVPALSVAG